MVKSKKSRETIEWEKFKFTKCEYTTRLHNTKCGYVILIQRNQYINLKNTFNKIKDKKIINKTIKKL